MGRVSEKNLDEAGITSPALRASYQSCRRLNADHGKTYYLATRLLPPAKRPYVHALYGFARYVDELVDGPRPDPGRLDDLADAFHRGDGTYPVLPALHDTIRRWAIPVEHIDAFFTSMRMDLSITEYKTYDDLLGYMQGSAAVIGLQMLPILEPMAGHEREAAAYARDLGIAFQLANFIRDVGEDLDRGRLYLPREDLELFDVSRADLRTGIVDARVRRLLAFEITRAREVFRAAEPGIALLHPSSRPCIRTAFVLYREILDAVEAADYQVLTTRASVGLGRRLAVALPALVRAWAARH